MPPQAAVRRSQAHAHVPGVMQPSSPRKDSRRESVRCANDPNTSAAEVAKELEIHPGHSVTKMCRWAQVSRSVAKK